MADEKKSFLLYTDLINTFEELKDAEAGKLIKHILRYVNDKNPVAPDRITKITFEPIKLQLKRDLVKYEKKRVLWSDAGKASAEKKRKEKEGVKKSTESTDVEFRSTESTVNCNNVLPVTVIQKNNSSILPEQVPVVKILKEKRGNKKPPIHSEFNECKNHWLNEVHKGFIFSAAKGAALNQLLTKIKESYKLAGVDYIEEIIVEAFKRFCKGLNGTWCEDKDIDVVNGKYNEIIIEIKKNKNSPKPKPSDPTILPYSLLKSKQDKIQ